MLQNSKLTDTIISIVSEGTEISLKRETVLGVDSIRIMLYYSKNGNKFQTTKFVPFEQLNHLAEAVDEVNLLFKTTCTKIEKYESKV